MTGTTSLLGISFSDRDWMESFSLAHQLAHQILVMLRGKYREILRISLGTYIFQRRPFSRGLFLEELKSMERIPNQLG